MVLKYQVKFYIERVIKLYLTYSKRGYSTFFSIRATHYSVVEDSNLLKNSTAFCTSEAFVSELNVRHTLEIKLL